MKNSKKSIVEVDLDNVDVLVSDISDGILNGKTERFSRAELSLALANFLSSMDETYFKCHEECDVCGFECFGVLEHSFKGHFCLYCSRKKNGGDIKK